MGLLFVMLAELFAWAAIGYAVYRIAGSDWTAAAIAAVVVLLVLVAWGKLASPRATASPAVSLATKLVVYAAAVLGLALTGHAWWALALAAFVVVVHLAERFTRSSPEDEVNPLTDRPENDPRRF